LFFFFDALLAVFAVSSSFPSSDENDDAVEEVAMDFFPSRDEDRVVKALETPRAATVVGVAVVVRQKPPTRRTTSSLNREEVKEIEDFEFSSSCFSIRFISFSPLFCVDINFFTKKQKKEKRRKEKKEASILQTKKKKIEISSDFLLDL
jgi:hypothetical protein